MATSAIEYVGERVEITFAEGELEGGDSNVVVGKIENANALGFVFKPAGSSKSRLYETGAVEDIRIAPEAEPVLKARRLDFVTLKTVKRHLVDRHGYSLADINEMSPERALEFHDDLDHEAQDLSHYHDLPKSQKNEVAAEAQHATEQAATGQASGEVEGSFEFDDEDEF